MGWEDDLERVRARLAALEPDRELASAREAAATWRAAERGSGFFLPLPAIAQDLPNVSGAWLDRPTAEDHPDQVALDEQDRPVVHLDHAGDIVHLWFWEDDAVVELDLGPVGPHVRLARAEDDRLVRVVTASPESTRLRLLRWKGDRPVRVDGAERFADGGWDDTTVLDDDGRFPRLLTARLRGEGDLAAGAAAARRLKPREPLVELWALQPEPWPGDAAVRALAEPLAQALDAAIRRAAEKSGVRVVAALQVMETGSRWVPTWRREADPAFPPWTVLGGLPRRPKGAPPSTADVLSSITDPDGAGIMRVLVLPDFLDDEALRACRVLTTARRNGAPQAVAAVAATVAAEIGTRLQELLAATPFPGVTDYPLDMVEVGTRDAGVPAEPEAPLDPADRGALEAAAREAGLEEHAARLAHDVAVEGLLLKDSGTSAMRLGGPPLLPAGAAWPVREDGRPLTFLAGIDMAKLPAGHAHEGWFLFFADLDAELADLLPNHDGSPTRLLVTDEPVAADGPALPAVYVAPRARLTLPDGWAAAEELGIEDADAYDELTTRLYVADASASPERGRHWIGGLVRNAQGEPPTEDTILLLHLGWDPELGFTIDDGGSLQFRIPADALAAGDWSQTRTESSAN